MYCFDKPTILLMLLMGVLAGFAPAQDSRSVQDHRPLPGTGPLPGTMPLTLEGDLASLMLDGVDKFLLAETRENTAVRRRAWRLASASPQEFTHYLNTKRERLAQILGVRDERLEFEALELITTTKQPALVAKSARTHVYLVRWPVLEGVDGEGLWLVPVGREIVGDMVAIPDADQTPEQFAGLVNGVPPELQLAGRLAEAGYRVLVPTLLNRSLKRRSPPGQKPGQNGRANLTNREYVYRPAFELGRHVIGYELQKVLACIDWFYSERELSSGSDGMISNPIGVAGYGEGGMLALYAAALDERIDVSCVSGFFGSRDGLWKEPVDRNAFGLLTDFGGAELACMTYPRSLFIDFRPGPKVDVPSEGGAPGTLTPITVAKQKSELAEMLAIIEPLSGKGPSKLEEMTTALESAQCGVWMKGAQFQPINCDSKPSQDSEAGIWELVAGKQGPPDLTSVQDLPQDEERQQRQLQQLDDFNQRVLANSRFTRREFMKTLDTSSIEAFEKSVQPFREIFREQVIGKFNRPLLPLNARSRVSWTTDDWTGYEVVLDVFPGVLAYGVLLVPHDLMAGEKRPVVVCQHGLEGRPTDVFLGDHPAYQNFAAKLCERGYIVFAPQNLYIFQDRFRTLQRKANPLGKTLFSVLVPQHQQIVDWLKLQPFVDPERIAFYGLSYGGKSAMRIPALVPDYCLSICSADFNEWVWKNASTKDGFSYVWTGEYEIFEWDLGSTFNYAEMAALICPRPFMVERGHFDGVGEDEWVAFEYAKVRRLYQAKLGIGNRTAIEWFPGPHTINGKGTFEFLDRHLNWPRAD